MSRRCACGCGRRCTVSEDWASEDCHQRWMESRWQAQPLPDGEAVTMSQLSRIFGIPADLITAWRRSWLS